MAACSECGIDETGITIGDGLNALRSFPRRFREAVQGVPDPDLRARPMPQVWSMLEYLVHTREVFEVLGMGLPLVLERPGITFPEFSVDETVTTRPDWVMNPELALTGIEDAVGRLLAAGDSVSNEAWARPFTLGAERHDAGWIVRHAAHEGVHHLRDIAQVHAMVTGEPAD